MGERGWSGNGTVARRCPGGGFAECTRGPCAIGTVAAMTTSMASSWFFVVGGFAGLMGMQLVLIRAMRSQRQARCPERARREDAAARLQDRKV